MASKLWEIPDIDPLQYDWKKSDEMLVPVWFQGPQFPPSFGKKSKTKTASDGYEADNEDKKEGQKRKRQKKQKRVNEADSPPAGRKFRRMIPELTSDMHDTTEMEPMPSLLTSVFAGTNDQTLGEGDSTITNSENSGNDASDEMEDLVDISEVDDDSDGWEHFSEFDETPNSSDSDWM